MLELRKRRQGFSIALAVLGASASAQAADSSATPQFQIGSKEVIMSPAQRTSLGFEYFGDAPLVAMLWRGQLSWFVAASAKKGDHAYRQGTYHLNGTLTSFTGRGVPSLEIGRVAPSPDGSVFDRDYVGGGSVFSLGDLGGKTELVHLYHGEFYYNRGGFPFYSSIGIAVSNDDGKSFRKLGEALSPRTPRGAPKTVQVSAPRMISREGYVYVFYTDLDPALPPPCNLAPCIAVARARTNDVVSAINQGRVPVLHKYYLNKFEEPSLQGRFTPLLSDSREWQGDPFVAYYPALGSYVMVHTMGDHGIFLRTSEDLLHWSVAQELVSSAGHGTVAIYPALVSERANPAVLDESPWLYYLDVSADWPSWTHASLVRRRLSLH